MPDDSFNPSGIEFTINQNSLQMVNTTYYGSTYGGFNYTQTTDSLTYPNGFPIPFSNELRKSGIIVMEVSTPGLVTTTYDPPEFGEPGWVPDAWQEETIGEGYWTISTKNFGISGYPGVYSCDMWEPGSLEAGQLLTSTSNPLYDTELDPLGGIIEPTVFLGGQNPGPTYDPDEDGPIVGPEMTFPGGIGISAWMPEWQDFNAAWNVLGGWGGGVDSGIYCSASDVGEGTDLNPNTYFPDPYFKYKVFHKNLTLTYGHQNPSDPYDTETLALQQAAVASGDMPEVFPGEDAVSRWDPNVKTISMWNTLGFDVNTGEGKQGNQVLVAIVLNQGVSIPQGQDELVINVDIDGDAVFVPVAPEEGVGSQSPVALGASILNSKILINDEQDLSTIIPMNGWKGVEVNIGEKEIAAGLSMDLNRYRLSGKSLLGKSKRIASIVVEAETDTHFSSKPYISSLSSDVKIKQTDVTETNGNPTRYVFSATYTASSNRTFGDIEIDLKYETEETVAKTTTIDDIVYGDYIINSSGAVRDIVVHGTPGATFALAINEGFEETIEGKSHVDKVNDVSILDKSNANSKTSHDYGKDINIIKRTIGSKGFYSFKQKFPSTISRKTKKPGAGGSASKIIFDDLTDVRVGDRVYALAIPTSSNVTVATLNPDGDNVNECTLSEAVNLAANSNVVFKRKKCYNIDIIPDLTSTLSSTIPTTKPAYKLYQYVDPIVTLRHSISGTNMTVTHNNSIATGLSAGAEHDIIHNGRANMKGSQVSQNAGVRVKSDVSILIDLVDGAEVFSGYITPRLSMTGWINDTSGSRGSSSWSNVNPEFNGGTEVSITNQSFSRSGLNTITLSYTFIINKFGTEDVTIELSLDKHLIVT